jgi:hypothetical protein
MSNETKQNAAQRLALLEQNLEQMRQIWMNQVNVIAEEIGKLSQSVIDVETRLNAFVNVETTLHQVNVGAGINKIIVDNNVKTMETQVNELISQGVLKKVEDGIVQEKSFVVGRTVNEKGDILNPRIQYYLPSMADLQTALITKKVGDVVKFGEGQVFVEISEVYDVINIEKNVNFEQPAETPAVQTSPKMQVVDSTITETKSVEAEVVPNSNL